MIYPQNTLNLPLLSVPTELNAECANEDKNKFIQTH